MKKTKSIKIAIPKPCSESWNNMSPNENGKHCSSCEKTVIDFSRFNDSEIYKVLAENNSKVCGRFYKFQLNRNIFLQIKTKSSIYPRVLLTAAITACSLTISNAQENFSEVPTQIKNFNLNNAASGPEFNKDSTKLIRGKVIDSQTGEPIRFTSILIKEINEELKCDKDGNFEIEVTDSFPETFVLVTKEPNYFENGLEISKNKIPEFIVLKLETKYTFDGSQEFITGKIKVIYEPKEKPKKLKR